MPRGLLLGGLALLIFVGSVIGIHSYTAQYPGMNDFMSRWEGARSFWVDGLNPYGTEASLNIQYAIYSRPATALEDPGYFAYPLYMTFPLLPLVYLDYGWASAIWLTLLIAGLLLALFALLDYAAWQPRPLLLGALTLWTILSYFPARGLLLGQPGLLVYALEVLAIWALAKQRDTLAGVVLALSTVKPQMGYLIVPFLLLWGLREQRWRFVSAFSVAFGALLLGSFVLLPAWFGDWIAQIRLYPGYTELGSPIWILAHYAWLGIDPATGKWGIQGGFGSVLEVIFTVGAYGLLLWAWYGVLIQRKSERLAWTIALTLVITHLVAPRTATPHFIVFLLPLVFYCRWLTQPRIRRGTLYALLLLGVLFIGQWAHFLLTVVARFEHPSVYLPMPLGIFALLWFTRRWWWGLTNLIPSPSPREEGH